MADRELGRRIYAFLRDRQDRGGLPSATWESLADEFDAWGDAVTRAVAASQGHLICDSQGIVRLGPALQNLTEGRKILR